MPPVIIPKWRCGGQQHLPARVEERLAQGGFAGGGRPQPLLAPLFVRGSDTAARTIVAMLRSTGMHGSLALRAVGVQSPDVALGRSGGLGAPPGQVGICRQRIGSACVLIRAVASITELGTHLALTRLTSFDVLRIIRTFLEGISSSPALSSPRSAGRCRRSDQPARRYQPRHP